MICSAGINGENTCFLINGALLRRSHTYPHKMQYILVDMPSLTGALDLVNCSQVRLDMSTSLFFLTFYHVNFFIFSYFLSFFFLSYSLPNLSLPLFYSITVSIFNLPLKSKLYDHLENILSVDALIYSILCGYM